MRRLFVLAVYVLALVFLGSCGRAPHYGQVDCDSQRGKYADACQRYRQRKADADKRDEVAQLLKAYRLCLQRYEAEPEKAREYCSMYAQMLRGIDLDREGETSLPGDPDRSRHDDPLVVIPIQ
jgi:hypothetical protein